ncbi:DUF6225 family protein [Streptomyces termitum]|uniref:Uncharacterized protein n=1 Tax=Streptomyces termitum TaxID=67368 RepID=A0A918T9J0_9ACTN|nr:DUF6225 family protein [Streptomyces termitum]GHB08212.1 hypothetical protein GCM10010305_59150 [Streptomyces termitum]
MAESEAEKKEHRPLVWTAGRLREALRDVPDDALVHIAVAPVPGALDYDDRVLIGYGAATLVRPATDEEPARTEIEHTLFADWPAGAYENTYPWADDGGQGCDDE